MSVQEIEEQITKLSAGELAELARWLEIRHAGMWDEQIEVDSRSGKLDSLIAEANADFDAGRCRQL